MSYTIGGAVGDFEAPPTNKSTIPSTGEEQFHSKQQQQAAKQHCIVFVDNRKELKQIGSIWKSSENPCQVHLCDRDEQGRAQEIITNETCEHLQCEEVSFEFLK